jgi:decaprenylphospho-beta-D-erythro-pentofuranosid-2-ulose 2-reductase
MSSPNTVVVVGATSGIARACAELYAKHGARIILAGRDIVELDRTAADLRLRHKTTVDTLTYDARALDAASQLVKSANELSPSGVGLVLVAHGTMVEQSEIEAEPSLAEGMIRANLTSVIELLETWAPTVTRSDFSTTFAVISSVAGDRGRQSNYVYGCTKAALTTYLEGLRNRLWHKGIHVLTIKPGFVATRMTIGKVNPKSPLLATPDQVARDIAAAVESRRNTIYTRWFWKWIMLVITSIPESVFKRLRL